MQCRSIRKSFYSPAPRPPAGRSLRCRSRRLAFRVERQHAGRQHRLGLRSAKPLGRQLVAALPLQAS